MRCDTRFLFINRIHRHYSWKIKFKTKIKKFKSLNGLKIVGGYNWDMQSVKKTFKAWNAQFQNLIQILFEDKFINQRGCSDNYT